MVSALSEVREDPAVAEDLLGTEVDEEQMETQDQDPQDLQDLLDWCWDRTLTLSGLTPLCLSRRASLAWPDPRGSRGRKERKDQTVPVVARGLRD